MASSILSSDFQAVSLSGQRIQEFGTQHPVVDRLRQRMTLTTTLQNVMILL